MVHGPGRMLIVALMRYSNSFVLRTISVFSDEKWPMRKGIRNRFEDSLHLFSHSYTLYSTRVRSYTDFQARDLLHKLLLSHTLWKSLSKAHCFDSRRMSSRRRVCRLINHLAADDLWSEWPYHDKLSEPCTFNYRSEGSGYISMRHPSPLLLIALR